MKDACIDLGTYEEYREVINKISQRIAIYPLLNALYGLVFLKVIEQLF